jgi:hypothetical protein
MKHTLICEACGTTFHATRNDALTCSKTCKTTRWRRLQRAELLRLRAERDV